MRVSINTLALHTRQSAHNLSNNSVWPLYPHCFLPLYRPFRLPRSQQSPHDQCFHLSPIKENNIARSGNIAAVHELSLALKPFHTCGTQRKLRDNSWLNISTLICTSAYKAGTPFHPAGKAVPTPVSVSSVSFMCQCHLYNRLISDSRRDASKHIVFLSILLVYFLLS